MTDRAVEQRTCRQVAEPGAGESGGCGACDARAGVSGGETAGWRLSAAAAGMFLCPVILAILGAVVCGGGQLRRLLGCVGGMSAGLAGSVIVAGILRSKRRAR